MPVLSKDIGLSEVAEYKVGICYLERLCSAMVVVSCKQYSVAVALQQINFLVHNRSKVWEREAQTKLLLGSFTLRKLLSCS